MSVSLKILRESEIQTGFNPEVVQFVNELCEAIYKKNLKMQRDWYVNDRFCRGDHWVVFNKTTNKLQSVPVAKGEVRRTVNKLRSQIRGVKNFIKRNEPRWEIHPDSAADAAYKEAAQKNKILQNVYRTRNLKGKTTDLIVNSLKYSVGILEGGIVKRNGEDYLDFWIDSTYDVLFDDCGDVQDCRFVIKTFKKPVEAIKSNTDYKIESKDNLQDNKESISEYKNVLTQEKNGNSESKGNKDLETALVKELWLKWNTDDGTKVRVITIIGNNVAQVYEPKYKRFPFFVYNPEQTSDSIYSDPWIKDMIPLIKSLDKTTSQIEAYVSRMLAGKYLIKQGVEVSSITDNGAEKVYYKGNVKPEQMQLQPLPSTPFSFVANLERWIEEFGGVREASLGRTPGSLQSGRALEALQAADASTVSEPVENLEKLLSDVGEFILEVLAEYTVASKTIVEGKQEVKFIGKAGKENPPENTLVLGNKTEVKVEIVPEISYSDSEKKEWLLRLADAKMVDQQTVLEQFQFSNVADVVERTKKRQEEEYKKEITKQRESHRTDGNGPQDTADMANQENMAMAAGQQVPMTPQVLWLPEHTKLHMAFIQENQDAYQQNQQLFDEHIAAEEQYDSNQQDPSRQGGQAY